MQCKMWRRRQAAGVGVAALCFSQPGSSSVPCRKPVLLETASYHTCTSFTDGGVRCWGGANTKGELGFERTELIQLVQNTQDVDMGGQEPISIGMQAYHSCALFRTGQVACWGSNEYGQLGVGTQVPFLMTAVTPVDLGLSFGTVEEVAVGGWHTCARNSMGQVKCWGQNEYGQLGLEHNRSLGSDASFLGDALPTVDLGSDPEEGAQYKAKQISAGAVHTCALLEGNHVKCWGGNFQGQLGLEDTIPRGDQEDSMGDKLPPITVTSPLTEVVCGWQVSCLMFLDGMAICWGQNQKGQLGVDHFEAVGTSRGHMGKLNRVQLAEGEQVVQLSVGQYHACARIRTIEKDPISEEETTRIVVKCWGENQFGQLGTGDTKLKRASDVEKPVDLGEFRTALHVVASNDGYSCAILDDSSVRCWGRNDAGQLGLRHLHSRGGDPDSIGDAMTAVSFDDSCVYTTTTTTLSEYPISYSAADAVFHLLIWVAALVCIACCCAIGIIWETHCRSEQPQPFNQKRDENGQPLPPPQVFPQGGRDLERGHHAQAVTPIDFYAHNLHRDGNHAKAPPPQKFGKKAKSKTQALAAPQPTDGAKAAAEAKEIAMLDTLLEVNQIPTRHKRMVNGHMVRGGSLDMSQEIFVEPDLDEEVEEPEEASKGHASDRVDNQEMNKEDNTDRAKVPDKEAEKSPATPEESSQQPQVRAVADQDECSKESPPVVKGSKQAAPADSDNDDHNAASKADDSKKGSKVKGSKQASKSHGNKKKDKGDGAKKNGKNEKSLG